MMSRDIEIDTQENKKTILYQKNKLSKKEILESVYFRKLENIEHVITIFYLSAKYLKVGKRNTFKPSYYKTWSSDDGIYSMTSDTVQFNIRQRSLIVFVEISLLCFKR